MRRKGFWSVGSEGWEGRGEEEVDSARALSGGTRGKERTNLMLLLLLPRQITDQSLSAFIGV